MCLGDSLCYLENATIAQYLDLTETRELLDVEMPLNLSSCSDLVSDGFEQHFDK
jgi:hypothetical protein